METLDLDAFADQLRDLIEDTNLAPATVGVMFDQLITVELTCPDNTRAATLREWLHLMVFRDQVVGQFSSGDDEHRLNLRGHLTRDLYPVAVAAVFRASTEPQLVDLIYRDIANQDPHALVNALEAGGA